MDNSESSHKCLKCGASLLPHAKFCTQCGHKIEIRDILCPSCSKELDPGTESCPFCGTHIDPTAYKEPEAESKSEAEPTKQDVVPSPPLPSEMKTTFDYGRELVSSLKENLSSVIVILGIISILAAVAFTIIVLLPKEIVSDVEIPPLEGFIFDLFVILGLIGLITKEIMVYLGYIPKKETLDKWFSFVLVLISWTNLITFSIGLVIKSLFFQIGLNLSAVFLFLSIINFVIAFLYFRRYQEPLFSCIFIISVMSILYLVQWIVPLDPILFTSLIFLTVSVLVIISYRADDLIIFIGLSILLPLMFLSPHLLSNSVVIAIIILLVLFPFIESILQKLIGIKREKINFKSFGELSSTFGMINVGFSVFYGYLLPELSVLILAIPVLGFLFLKVLISDYRRLPLRDGATMIFLAFILVFFDFILKNLLVLFAIAGFLVIYSTFSVFEYRAVQQENISRYIEFLGIASLVVVSMTRLLFIWKICFFLIPLFTILVLIQQKKSINYQITRGFIFGTEILILLAFIQAPVFDLAIIPIFSIIAIIGVIILLKLNEEEKRYSLDLTIFSMIFEVTLLIMMLWTESSVEMIYPVVILLILTVIISIIQMYRRIKPNFLWVNSTFIICFGLMTYWNEFEVFWTVLTVFLTALPMLIEKISKEKDESFSKENIIQSRNLNISISAIGLALIVFFEELDPISHSILFLIISIIWLVLYIFEKHYFTSLTESLIILSPGIIFIFEMVLHRTIFTPITDNQYLYLTLSVLAIPVITLQIDHFLTRKIKTPLNPIIVGTTIFSFTIMIALWTYPLQPIEHIFLISGLFIALVVSVFLINWYYESILLLLVSFFPSTLYASIIDLPPSFLLYLIPIFPILLNFIMGIRYLNLKLNFSIIVQEFLIVSYFGLIILFNPIQLMEYTTALFALFNFTWLFLGLIKRMFNQKPLILTNLVNSIFLVVLMILIENLYNPNVPEVYLTELGIEFPLRTALIGLILIIIIIVILIHLLSWQFTQINIDFSYLMAFILIFNSSTLILSLFQLVLRTTSILLNSILFGLLIVFTVLLISSLVSYLTIKRLKTEISLACIYTTTAWVILSSFYFMNIELVFLWLFFGPLMVLLFLAKQERSFILLGFIFYLLAGLILIEYTLEFLFSGIADWITILGLIIFGIELVSLGIYSSISGKNKKINLVQEI